MSTTHSLLRWRRLRRYGRRVIVDAPMVSALLEGEPADVF
jgi:hypothetical protein